MNNRLTTGILSLMILLSGPAFAAKSKVKLKNNGLVTVAAFDRDNNLLRKGYGFFITKDGIALAPYTTLKGASRAELTDSKGKTWNIDRIMGASDTYDMVKFSTDCKDSEAFILNDQPATKGSTVTRFISDGKDGITPIATDIVEAKQYDNLTYYTLSSKPDSQSIGTPVLDAAGKVVGVMQPNTEKSQTESYAADIAVEKHLQTSALSAGQTALNNIYIPKQLPGDTLQAASYIYLLANNAQDSVSYLTAIADFKAAYPDNATSYVEHANYAVAKKQYAEAETDYNEAFQNVKDQANVHYNFSKLLYKLNMYKSYEPYKDWTLDKALSEARQAYEASAQPLYQLQVGDCLFALKQYADAYEAYQGVNGTSFASSQTFYYAARARELMDDDSTTVLALLDSAVNRFQQPYTIEAGPFLLQRAQLRFKYGQYRGSALDFDAYEKLYGTQRLNDTFFYMKEQADLNANLYSWAMDDIEKALYLRPNEYLYIVEKAVIHLRVADYEEAIYEAGRALKLNPEGADAYKVLGIAYGQQNKKAEALKNLQKAKELGDPQVDEWIEQLK